MRFNCICLLLQSCGVCSPFIHIYNKRSTRESYQDNWLPALIQAFRFMHVGGTAVCCYVDLEIPLPLSNVPDP
ncbi:hypothetical protein Mapa_002502 [Marchantia paleacea]|nr:hypothetical protein Mapa_002502 [Marchantia paleacea]